MYFICMSSFLLFLIQWSFNTYFWFYLFPSFYFLYLQRIFGYFFKIITLKIILYHMNPFFHFFSSAASDLNEFWFCLFPFFLTSKINYSENYPTNNFNGNMSWHKQVTETYLLKSALAELLLINLRWLFLSHSPLTIGNVIPIDYINL